MADFGDNLVEALQPVLDLVNDILDKFNALSETDQTALVKTLGAIALLGPGLTITGKAISTIASGLELINKFKGAETAVEAAGADATKVAGVSTGGSALLGVGGVAAIGAGFYVAAQERLNNDNIRGSVNAINEATQGNIELQEAFINYVQANQDYQNLLDSGNANDEIALPVIENMNEANAAIQTIEGYQDVLDAYSAWRQENSLGSADWVMPENIEDLFASTQLNETMQQSGVDVAQGLADGITQNVSAAVSAAETMGTETIDAGNGALGVNSPSVLMIESGLNVVQGLANGITSGTPVGIAAMVAMANGVLSSANSILNVSNGWERIQDKLNIQERATYNLHKKALSMVADLLDKKQSSI